jgi:hypothetical protein
MLALDAARGAPMVHSAIDKLRKKNDGLRELVVQVIAIMLRNLVEQQGLPRLYQGHSPQLRWEMSAFDAAARLREVAMRCAQVGRYCADSRKGQELEDLSVELVDVAVGLEALLEDT